MGVGTRRASAVPARSASRPQHRLQDGRAARQDGRVGSERDLRRAHGRRASRREDDPVEGALLGSRAVHGRANQRASASSIPACASSCIPRCRGTSFRRPTTAARPNTSSARSPKPPPGTVWAVGTEVHLVNRLAQSVKPEKTVLSLDQFGCLCSTMFRVSPNHLLWILEGLLEGRSTTESSFPTSRSTGRRSRSIGCFPFTNHSPQRRTIVAHQLPPLPYAFDALEPHIDAQDHADPSWQASSGIRHQPERRAREISRAAVEDHRGSPARHQQGARGHPDRGSQQRRRAHEPHGVLAVDGAESRRRADRRAWRRDQVSVRQLRRIQGTVHQSRRHAVRQRLGMAHRDQRQAQHREHAQTRISRSWKARKRCSASTSGSTRTI